MDFPAAKARTWHAYNVFSSRPVPVVASLSAGISSLTIAPEKLFRIWNPVSLVELSVQLQLNDFVNPAGLEAIGRNLYRATPSSGDPVTGTPGSNGLGTLAQGFLEMSNVNVVEEMVAMIVAQRAYESNSKSIQTADQMLQMANNVKR